MVTSLHLETSKGQIPFPFSSIFVKKTHSSFDITKTEWVKYWDVVVSSNFIIRAFHLLDVLQVHFGVSVKMIF